MSVSPQLVTYNLLRFTSYNRNIQKRMKCDGKTKLCHKVLFGGYCYTSDSMIFWCTVKQTPKGLSNHISTTIPKIISFFLSQVKLLINCSQRELYFLYFYSTFTNLDNYFYNNFTNFKKTNKNNRTKSTKTLHTFKIYQIIIEIYLYHSTYVL